jgi:hypothetical protein
MAAKKKTKKKQNRPKETAAKKPVRRKPAKKKISARKNLTKKKPVLKKAAPKAKAPGRKRAGASTPRAARKPASGEDQFGRQRLRTRSAGQAGDLQGLSNLERADSESVHELVEEGNPFEADVVAGVQRAEDADEREVHTHEVPEDDVPGEYLDKD